MIHANLLYVELVEFVFYVMSPAKMEITLGLFNIGQFK
jgi:hypothetical protein